MPQTSQALLLLTRPLPQSQAFADRMAGSIMVRTILSPLLAITATSPLPDLSAYATIILTSSNAVEVLGTRLRGCSVVTVGAATAMRARAHGADARSLGADIERFLERSHSLTGPALWCRGVHTRRDIIAHLSKQGITADEAVIYDQVERPLRDEGKACLVGETPVVAPVFSPRTARLLSMYPATAPLRVLAMSPAVAKAWNGAGEVYIAPEPTQDAMFDTTLKVLQP